jgi:hypothetical protein
LKQGIQLTTLKQIWRPDVALPEDTVCWSRVGAGTEAPWQPAIDDALTP